jgi:uncharacterized protein (UPF0333 family)
MKKQFGGAVLAVVIVLAVIFDFMVMNYVSAVNRGVDAEAGIKAKYKNNENIYANGTQKVMEIAAVPEMYASDLKEIVTAAIQGRYGNDGSKATFQWLKEQNPNLDSSMYTKIQQVIESFRNEFQNAQTELLDRCQAYEKQRGYVWSGFWMQMAGYPKADIEKMCTPVSTDKARMTFETGIDKGIELRQPKK